MTNMRVGFRQEANPYLLSYCFSVLTCAGWHAVADIWLSGVPNRFRVHR